MTIKISDRPAAVTGPKRTTSKRPDLSLRVTGPMGKTSKRPDLSSEGNRFQGEDE